MYAIRMRPYNTCTIRKLLHTLDIYASIVFARVIIRIEFNFILRNEFHVVIMIWKLCTVPTHVY